MQKLFISGTVSRDPELRHTQSGDAILGFSLVVDNGKDANGNKRDGTFFDVSIWGKRGEALERHISKGDKLSLMGRPTARAKDSKAYLGIAVDDVTFMGGGRQGQQSSGAQRQASSDGFDDQDIPF